MTDQPDDLTPAPEKKHRVDRRILTGAAIAIVVVAGAAAWLVATAGPSAEQEQAAEQARVNATSAMKDANTEQRVYENCNAALEGTASALTELDSRLAVGMSYDEYSTSAGDASVAYGAIDQSAVTGDCALRAGLYIEEALNTHIEASEIWRKCLNRLCNFNREINAEMQEKWLAASNKITKANQALYDMKANAKSSAATAEALEAKADDLEAELQ